MKLKELLAAVYLAVLAVAVLVGTVCLFHFAYKFALLLFIVLGGIASAVALLSGAFWSLKTLSRKEKENE